MDIRREPKIDISVIDNKQLEELYHEILALIIDSELSYYSAVGLLETIKQDLISSALFQDDEDEDED
jgi:hypothetical protein